MARAAHNTQMDTDFLEVGEGDILGAESGLKPRLCSAFSRTQGL
jgi:hypothetical protein